jgi:hypothetical protein
LQPPLGNRATNAGRSPERQGSHSQRTDVGCLRYRSEIDGFPAVGVGRTLDSRVGRGTGRMTLVVAGGADQSSCADPVSLDFLHLEQIAVGGFKQEACIKPVAAARGHAYGHGEAKPRSVG